MASRVRLAATVALVDAAHFVEHRAVSPAVDAQVAYADVVVITKTDLADPAPALAAVAKLAPRAPVVRGTPAEVVAWLGRALADPETAPSRPMFAPTPRPHNIDSVWVPIERAVDAEELCDALETLPATYVRIKGLVPTGDGWVVVHRVGLRVSSEPLTRPPADGAGRIVALGPGVERGALAACVERAVVS
jgi:G3E family GTPase